jgi:peptide/nickel transport system substrate-binding protein
MKGKLWALVGTLVFAMVLAACGGDDGDGDRDGTATGKPVMGGTFTVAMARDATTLDSLRSQDVYSAMVMYQVLESLFDVDKDGRVVGRLVEKSENPQPNVYVWTLRQGIKFQDGTDFNAEAVKFNLERHINDATSTRNQDVKDITSIETPDASTVRITLKEAFRPFLSKFAGGGAGFMYSPTAVRALGENLARDLTNAGTGPFKFVEWRRDTQVVVERNPNYWQKDADGNTLPYLDRIIFKPFPDENVRLTNIKTGEVDALIGNPPYKDIAELKASGDLKVEEIPGLGFSFIHFNTSKPPFNNVNLRRAVAYAIDRDQVRRTVMFGNGNVLDTLVPEGLGVWYNADSSFHPYLRQDLNKARQELQAGGMASGFKFTFQISNASPELQQTAELIKDQLRAVNIDMEIQLIEFATVVANGRSGDYEAHGLGWSGGIDPDGNLASLFLTDAGFNFSKISDTDLDRFINQSRTEVDQARAKQAVDSAIKRWLELTPMTVYFNAPQISTVRKNVQNYPQTYNGYWGGADYFKIWKTN